MKRLLVPILFIYALLVSTWGLFTIPAHAEEEELFFSDTIIRQDVTWSGNIAIEGVFVVGRGATLTIQPGTTVRFHKIDSNNDQIGDSEIRVLGRIMAKGTRESPITFKSAEKNPMPRDWSYVLIFASARKNFLQYCIFRDAFTGLQVHFSTASVSDSVFTHNNEGLRFGRAKFTITHNLIENNNIGVRFTRMEGPVEISGNNITRNRIGIFLAPSSQQIVDFFEPGRTGKPWNEGHLIITGNNINANTDYDLNLGAKQIWDLAIGGNWWGLTDPQIIRTKIFDKLRDDVLGRAIYQPVRETPVREAGPR
ncbi:MAG: right-handed parallel beta-helix repeat-containing protein [Desulfobulbaceae bacterium]|nr:right-handed parallel beta-helix repeat-containing protein [Desulfobulbaceae bacterium]